jgi:hypothetical protein
MGMSSLAEMWEHSRVHKIAHRLLLWSGMASGLTLTLVLAFMARSTGEHTRGLILLMVLVNILMMVPWQWKSMPQWLYAPMAIARGFHWIVNLMFGCFGLLLLAHAGAPRRAIAFGVLSMMFVLWAAAARRLSHRDDT